MLEAIYAQLQVIEAIIVSLFVALGLTFGGVNIPEEPILDTSIAYKNNNMAVEFISNNIVIGQALLKSHKTYDEVLEIVSGKDRTVIWYEFSGFDNIKMNALKGVEFIDMREEIVDESNLELKEPFELSLIPNPNYLLPITKDYHFVYLQNDEWLPYNSLDISKENIIIGVQIDLAWGEFLDVVLNIMENKLDRHALVMGTNAGFVTVAPTGDPAATAYIVDDRALAMKDTSPATAGKIVEMGWYHSEGDDAATFELGIYSHDSGNDKPDELLWSDSAAKGAGGVWQRMTDLDITISPETIYWLALQLDDTATQTKIDGAFTSGASKLKVSGQTTLITPWGDSGVGNYRWTIYAVWEEAAAVEEESIIGDETWW